MKNISFILVAILLSACHFGGKSIHGSGKVASENRSISNFSNLQLSGSFDVKIKQATTPSLTLVADDNLLQWIETKKEGNNLILKWKDNTNIHTSNSVKIEISAPTPNEINISGSGNVKSDGQLENTNNLKLDISGSGNLDLNVKTPSLSVSIAGSGKATLHGETRDLDIAIAGSGDYLGENLKSENATIAITGSGSAKLYASKNLNASITGSGDIWYAGKPTIQQQIVGNGSLKALP